MSAQFIDRSNPLEHRYQQQLLERHKKRLEEIQNKKVKKRKNLEIEISQRLNDNKKQIHEIMWNQQQDSIDKQNQKLLKKLVEIQAGKQSQLPKSQSSSQLQDYRAKSLHITKRKLELERIERENLKIAQKIYDLKPYLQIEELEEGFNLHRKYSQNIRRLVKKRQPNHDGKLGHLPPIDGTQSADGQDSQKISKKGRFGAVSQSVDLRQNEDLLKQGEERKQETGGDMQGEIRVERNDTPEKQKVNNNEEGKKTENQSSEKVSKRPSPAKIEAIRLSQKVIPTGSNTKTREQSPYSKKSLNKVISQSKLATNGHSKNGSVAKNTIEQPRNEEPVILSQRQEEKEQLQEEELPQ